MAKVLDNLADQLTALGHMDSETGRASPVRGNPFSGARAPAWAAPSSRLPTLLLRFCSACRRFLYCRATPN